jgi:hypothetical protein
MSRSSITDNSFMYDIKLGNCHLRLAE